MAKTKKIMVYRNINTGKFVSNSYAKKHPTLTFKQTVTTLDYGSVEEWRKKQEKE